MGAILSFLILSSANKIHFPDNPAAVTIRKSDKPDDYEQISLRTLIEKRCPSLFSAFRPAWWLPNGHFQTIYCVLGNFSKTDTVVYERTYLRLLDGGTIGLDFFSPDPPEAKDTTPIIVVLHGLTGGSYESYVRSVLGPACSPTSKGGLGYRAVVVNFRGCAGVPISSSQLYSAGYTDDIRISLTYINKLYPRAPLIGLGFSLGANIMTRYLAEEGEQSRMVAACVLACPWDLYKNNVALEGSLLGRHVYSKGMGGNLLRLIKTHGPALSKDPGHRVTEAFWKATKLKNPTLEKFDDTFICVAGGSAPTFPFANSTDYYNWASSHKVVADVKVPYLAINAADDPVVRDVPLNAGGNSFAIMVLTSGGGHLGWFESDAGGGYGEVTRWVKRPALEWLRVVGDEMIHNLSKQKSFYEDQGGYLREEGGRNDFGCKVIESGDVQVADQSSSGMIQGL